MSKNQVLVSRYNDSTGEHAIIKDGNKEVHIMDPKGLIVALGGYTSEEDKQTREQKDYNKKIEQEAYNDLMKSLQLGISTVDMRIAHLREFDKDSKVADGMEEAVNTIVDKFNSGRRWG